MVSRIDPGTSRRHTTRLQAQCYRGTVPTPDETEDSRQKSAEDVMKAVAGGADVGEETFKHSNEFADEWTSRIVAKLKRIFRR